MKSTGNIPFTHKQVEKLRVGFTPSGYHPNRKQRRLYLQKSERNNSYGFHVHHYQWVTDKDGNTKRIAHLSLHSTKGNW